ncbi:hypothetical protein QL093DRAFT_2022678 [Fusarium oxysporum]|nr:hypothetical protein QL093DRAFT_2022678 [Fusarium oxysporum]
MDTDNQSQLRATWYRVWFVSGCSRGLGRNIVTATLARGDKVVATSRRSSDLYYVKDNANVKLLSLDVSSSQEAVDQMVQEAISAFGVIDILINNAGYVLSGPWEQLRYATNSHMQFNSNLFGAINLTRSVLPHLRRRRSGTILFMGSISGWHSVAAGGAYSATKFALEGAAEAPSEEVGPLGIRVHVFVLGRFHTDILNAENKRGSLSSHNDFEDYDAVKKGLADVQEACREVQPGDPIKAAERIVDIASLDNLTKEQQRNLP